MKLKNKKTKIVYKINDFKYIDTLSLIIKFNNNLKIKILKIFKNLDYYDIYKWLNYKICLGKINKNSSFDIAMWFRWNGVHIDDCIYFIDNNIDYINLLYNYKTYDYNIRYLFEIIKD